MQTDHRRMIYLIENAAVSALDAPLRDSGSSARQASFSFSRHVAPFCPALDSAVLPPYKNALTLPKIKKIFDIFWIVLGHFGLGASFH